MNPELLSPEIIQDILSYATAVITGIQDGVVGTAEMLAHPVDQILIPICQLVNDSVLVTLDYAESHVRDAGTETFIKRSAQNAWTNMRERCDKLASTVTAFENATGSERTHMLSEMATCVFLPGYVIKAAKGIVNLQRLGKANPAVYHQRRIAWDSEFFTIREKIQERLGFSSHRSSLATPRELSSIADIRSKSLASQETYAYVIMPNGEFRSIHQSLGGHDRLTGGKPILMGGDIVAENRRIIKVDNRTGDYVPYLEEDVMKHVFNKIGATEINTPGVIQQTYLRAESRQSGMRKSSALQLAKPHPIPGVLELLLNMEEKVVSHSNDLQYILLSLSLHSVHASEKSMRSLSITIDSQKADAVSEALNHRHTLSERADVQAQRKTTDAGLDELTTALSATLSSINMLHKETEAAAPILFADRPTLLSTVLDRMHQSDYGRSSALPLVEAVQTSSLAPIALFFPSLNSIIPINGSLQPRQDALSSVDGLLGHGFFSSNKVPSATPDRNPEVPAATRPGGCLRIEITQGVTEEEYIAIWGPFAKIST